MNFDAGATTGSKVEGVKELPTDVLSIVFEKLSAKEICACCCVSKHWNDTACQFDSLWKKFLVSDLRIPSPPSAHHHGKSFKKMYHAERSLRFGNPKKVCLKAHTGIITCLDMHGPRLISGSEDGFMTVWNSGQKGWEIDLSIHVRHSIVCVSSDEPWVVLGLKNGEIQVRNLCNGGALFDTLTGHDGCVDCVEIAHPIVVSGCADKSIKAWNVDSFNRNGCEKTLMGHQGAVSCVLLDKERGRVVSGSTDWTIRVWDLHWGVCLREFRGHRGVVHCLELFENGEMVSASSRVVSETFAKRERFGKIEVRNRSDGRCMVNLEDDEDAILCLKHNGVTLVGGGWDGRLRFWSLHSGKCFRTLRALPGYVSHMVFEGWRIAFGSGDDGTIHVWEFCQL